MPHASAEDIICCNSLLRNHTCDSSLRLTRISCVRAFWATAGNMFNQVCQKNLTFPSEE